MKKYPLGMTAIVLAIGLNAFTAVKKTSNKDKVFTSYYWYRVNSTGTALSSAKLNATPITKASAKSTLVPECTDDMNQPLCVVGSADGSFQIGDQIPAHSDPNQILKKTP